MKRVISTSDLMLAGVRWGELFLGASVTYGGRTWKVTAVNTTRVILED